MKNKALREVIAYTACLIRNGKTDTLNQPAVIPGHEVSRVVDRLAVTLAACAPNDAVVGTTTGMGAYAEYLLAA